MRRRLRVAGLVGAALALGGLLVAASGVVPVKASSGHFAVTQAFLRFSMKRSIATHAFTIDVPGDLADPDLVLKGACHYETGCRPCHGEPGKPTPPIARRMLPRPPDLAQRVRESSPRKLFYVVKHGMKFTGMPAWPSPKRDDEAWAMVAFLLAYPDLDAPAYLELVQREGAAIPADAGLASGGGASSPRACARCHGPDGLGRGDIPRIAGQRAEYLRAALEAYASGRRNSGIMEPVAAELPAGAIAELASFYASLREDAPAAREVTNAEAVERGRVIAREGILEQRVPACVECHGPGARRGKPRFPTLAGQDADYLRLQLALFAEQRRGGASHEHLMRTVASRLTSAQARDVSLYFASLPWDAGQAPAPGP